MKEYNNLVKKLGDKEKESLKKHFEPKLEALKIIWRDEICTDAKHLELVNICYNLFTRSTSINHVTGYRVILVDPLFTLGIKNFDLALYNEDIK